MLQYALNRVIIVVVFCCLCGAYEWLTTKELESAIHSIEKEERKRESKVSQAGGTVSASPFIASDSLREAIAPMTSLKSVQKCHMDPTLHKQTGGVIYVESDCLAYFARNVISKLEHPYVLLVHEGAPGNSPENGRRRVMPPQPDGHVQPILKREFYAGRLIGYHGQNLWWDGHEHGVDRPSYLHCVPRGIDGAGSLSPKVYVEAMRALLSRRKSQEETAVEQGVSHEKTLLLLDESLLEGTGLPLGGKAVNALAALLARKEFGFNRTRIPDHQAWLDAVTRHRFTLVPSGLSLDSHHIMDVLLLGGIPVLRRNSVSSCYDDSDNQMNLTTTRGALPIVWVDSWREVTNAHLESEWKRIVQVPPRRWDVSRLFVKHWLHRARHWNEVFDDAPFPEVTSRLTPHMYLHNEEVKGLFGRGY